jgi:hypothetical protein
MIVPGAKEPFIVTKSPRAYAVFLVGRAIEQTANARRANKTFFTTSPRRIPNNAV